VKKLTVKPAETMRISYLGFNMRDMPGANPVQNLKVRQAIAHAVDREKLVKHVIGEGASIPKAACYRTQFGCRQDVAQYEYDPAKSKKLLAEAGFPNGLTVDLVAFRSREWTEAVAGYLNAVGIKTNVSVLPFPAAHDRVLNNTLHVYLAEWGSYSINDASAILNNFFTLAPNDIAQDKELAALVKTASSTTDSKVRVATYNKALGRIADQVYWQPLWVHPVVYAHSADLDFKPFADENPRFFLTGWKK
jgi:peptide/nickel transport system substrate-binding protein